MEVCVKIDIDLSHSLKLKFEGNIKLFIFFKFDLLYYYFFNKHGYLDNQFERTSTNLWNPEVNDQVNL